MARIVRAQPGLMATLRNALIQRYGSVRLLLAVGVLGMGCGSSEPSAPDARRYDSSPPPSERRLILLHTNDLHDHLMGFAPTADYSPETVNDDATVGGAARLRAVIERERAAAGDTPVLLVDAGDFLMGTVFTMLNRTHAPQLALLQEAGYDAVTLGNHELDWGPAGLAAVLEKGIESGFTVPVLCANARLSTDEPGDDEIAQLYDSGAIRPHLVRVLDNGLRVGIVGLLGPDAYAVSPRSAPIVFDEDMDAHVESAQAAVNALRASADLDLVIALAHEGGDDEGVGEISQLAAGLHDVDVVIGGHTHVALSERTMVGDTAIAQTGSFGTHVGRLELAIDDDGKVSVVDYRLLPVDDAIAGHAATQDVVEGFIGALDDRLGGYSLGEGGKPLSFRSVLAETSFELTQTPFQEHPLGDLVSDAYLTAVAALPGSHPRVAVEASGVIRDDLVGGETGALWFADVFRVLPLGEDADGVVGYPLVTYYLTNRDLKAGMEITAAAAILHKAELAKYFLQVSGMTVEYRATGPLFDAVAAIRLDGDDEPLEWEDDDCHEVVSNLYVAQLLGAVGDLSGGMLSMTAWQQGCETPVTDWLAQRVDADPEAEGVQELKTWHALARSLASFPDEDDDGVPDLPSRYADVEGRIVPVE